VKRDTSLKLLAAFICVGAVLSLCCEAKAQSVPGRQVTFVVGGDVQWSFQAGVPDILYDNPQPKPGEWLPVP
jgi:hypothetical protein